MKPCVLLNYRKGWDDDDDDDADDDVVSAWSYTDRRKTMMCFCWPVYFVQVKFSTSCKLTLIVLTAN